MSGLPARRFWPPRDPLPAWLLLVAGQVSLLAILALGLGLLVVLHVTALPAPSPVTPSATFPVSRPPTRLGIPVPWPAASERPMVLAYVGQQRVLLLDMRGFYQDLLRLPVQDSNAPATINERDMKVRFFPVTNQVYCLELQLKPHAGEVWERAQRPDSAWRTAVEHYSPADYAYFFWVRNDSFEVFRRVRQALRQQHTAVTWKPMQRNAPLEACTGFEGGDLRPQ